MALKKAQKQKNLRERRRRMDLAEALHEAGIPDGGEYAVGTTSDGRRMIVPAREWMEADPVGITHTCCGCGRVSKIEFKFMVRVTE